jgi:hypothetical protein
VSSATAAIVHDVVAIVVECIGIGAGAHERLHRRMRPGERRYVERRPAVAIRRIGDVSARDQPRCGCRVIAGGGSEQSGVACPLVRRRRDLRECRQQHGQ